MVSSCRGLDACSGLAAAAGILLLLCLQALSGAYHCRIEALHICSSAYPRITSCGVRGGKLRGNELTSHSPHLSRAFARRSTDCPAWGWLLLQLGEHHVSLSSSIGLHIWDYLPCQDFATCVAFKASEAPDFPLAVPVKSKRSTMPFLKGWHLVFYHFSSCWCCEEREASLSVHSNTRTYTINKKLPLEFVFTLVHLGEGLVGSLVLSAGAWR